MRQAPKQACVNDLWCENSTYSVHLKGFMPEMGCPGFALPLASSFATYSPCCLATCMMTHHYVAASSSWSPNDATPACQHCDKPQDSALYQCFALPGL